MSDLINRQAAIDAMNEVYCHIEMIKNRPVNKTEQAIYLDMMGAVKSVPSAEPEIVRCKDCKLWDKSEDGPLGYCMAMKHNYFSRSWEISIYRKCKGDFYCADAEREDNE